MVEMFPEVGRTIRMEALNIHESSEPGTVVAETRGAETSRGQNTGNLLMVVKGSTLLKNGSLEYSVATWAN